MLSQKKNIIYANGLWVFVWQTRAEHRKNIKLTSWAWDGQAWYFHCSDCKIKYGIFCNMISELWYVNFNIQQFIWSLFFISSIDWWTYIYSAIFFSAYFIHCAILFSAILIEGLLLCFNQNEGYKCQGKEESCEARESSGSEKEVVSDNVSNVLFFLLWVVISMLCLCRFLFPLHNIQFKEFLVVKAEPWWFILGNSMYVCYAYALLEF